MGNFVYDFFKMETIENEVVENLDDILNLLNDEYLNLIASNYKIDIDEYNYIKLKEEIKNRILKDFQKNLSNFNKDEHKSFYDFYNGAVEYTDENLYLNLKKFADLGIIFLFTKNKGKLYEFIIPIELLNIYEKLLKTM